MRLCYGPAAGTYVAARAPAFVRAVVDEGGKRDVLDQLDDAPRQDERVYVYELIAGTGSGTAIVCGRGFSIDMALGDYRHRADVDGEQLRETEAWRAWCLEERDRRPELAGYTLERSAAAT